MLDGMKGIIFDLDGTLIDSMWIWEQIDIDYLARFQHTLPSGMQNEINGMSFLETANYFKNRFQIPDSIETIQNDWNTMAWQKYEEEVQLKDGVFEFLEHLKELNIPCGIASSNSKELIELVVKKHGIDHYFKSIRNSCEVKQGKPAPDIYLLVAEDMGIRPEECLVFEDVLQGVQGGKSANMKVCNVYDIHVKQDSGMIKKIADYFIKSYHEIMEQTYEVINR